MNNINNKLSNMTIQTDNNFLNKPGIYKDKKNILPFLQTAKGANHIAVNCIAIHVHQTGNSQTTKSYFIEKKAVENFIIKGNPTKLDETERRDVKNLVEGKSANVAKAIVNMLKNGGFPKSEYTSAWGINAVHITLP